MKPYSALFGTLKVLDEVEVVLEGLSGSVAVDRLRVEPALDAGRQRAGAVRVERDVLDRLELASPADHAPSAQSSVSGAASSAMPASSRALVADLAGRARDRRRRAVRRARVEAVARRRSGRCRPARPSRRAPGRRARPPTSSAYSGSLPSASVVRLTAPSCRSGARAGRLRDKPRQPLLFLLLGLGASRWRSWWAVSALCSSRSQNAGCGPPSGCGGTAGRSQPG